MALYKSIDTCKLLDGNEQLALLLDLFEAMEKGKVQSLDLISHYAIMGFNLTLMWEQYQRLIRVAELSISPISLLSKKFCLFLRYQLLIFNLIQ